MPAERPFTIPVAIPTVATEVVLLVHVPPPVLLNVVVLPTQTLETPVIADGSELTVIVFVVVHPVPSV